MIFKENSKNKFEALTGSIKEKIAGLSISPCVLFETLIIQVLTKTHTFNFNQFCLVNFLFPANKLEFCEEFLNHLESNQLQFLYSK
jgi:hypothetical protein